ncbi:hypothetical protein JCM5296_003240 [Sporobolomyces johnsonii]
MLLLPICPSTTPALSATRLWPQPHPPLSSPIKPRLSHSLAILPPSAPSPPRGLLSDSEECWRCLAPDHLRRPHLAGHELSAVANRDDYLPHTRPRDYFINDIPLDLAKRDLDPWTTAPSRLVPMDPDEPDSLPNLWSLEAMPRADAEKAKGRVKREEGKGEKIKTERELLAKTKRWLNPNKAFPGSASSTASGLAVKDVACEVGSKFGCNSSSLLAAITWSYGPLKKASMEEVQPQVLWRDGRRQRVLQVNLGGWDGSKPVVFDMDKMADVVKRRLREMATLLDGNLTLDTALPDLNLEDYVDDWGTKATIVEQLQELDGHCQLLVHTATSPNTALGNMLFLLNLHTGLPTPYLQSADSYMLDCERFEHANLLATHLTSGLPPRAGTILAVHPETTARTSRRLQALATSRSSTRGLSSIEHSRLVVKYLIFVLLLYGFLYQLRHRPRPGALPSVVEVHAKSCTQFKEPIVWAFQGLLYGPQAIGQKPPYAGGKTPHGTLIGLKEITPVFVAAMHVLSTKRDKVHVKGKGPLKRTPKLTPARYAKLYHKSCAMFNMTLTTAVGAKRLQENHIIYVYCYNSWDKVGVAKAFKALIKNLCLVPVAYKCDAISILGSH